MKARRDRSRLANTFAASVAAAEMSPKETSPLPTVVHSGPGELRQTRPFSIRLTEAEREALRTAAGTKPVGTFVREKLLDTATPRKTTRRPASDKAMLGQILATLGRSGLNAGLAELGTAARLGTIVITPEMETQILAVCADIQEVKRMLLRGLGLAEERGR